MATRSRMPRLSRAGPLSIVLMMGLGGMPLAETGRATGDDSELLRQVEKAAHTEREYRTRMAQQTKAEQREREAAQDEARLADLREQEGDTTRTERDLQQQVVLQEALIRQSSTRNEEAEATDRVVPDPSSQSITDPRIAAPAPSDRVLPEEIFDRSEEEIVPGTWDNEKPLRVSKLILDADGDGQPELIRYVERDTGVILRQESDRNYNGVLDAWHLYRGGDLSTRILDENDDGNPDVFETYRDGKISLRELDRDDDGVRDFFYRYRGDSLVEERHDANNDGVMDLVILYQKRLRLRAEEDTDRDGRMDLWTRYGTDGGVERVMRIERDTRGGGFADTFEIFETKHDRAIIVRREQDLNGDGEIDIVSFYQNGKLKRRQIRDSKLSPLSPDAAG